jgi:hypothetical protein
MLCSGVDELKKGITYVEYIRIFGGLQENDLFTDRWTWLCLLYRQYTRKDVGWRIVNVYLGVIPFGVS